MTDARPAPGTNVYSKLGKYHSTLRFYRYDRPEPFKPGTLNPTGTYIFPLPINLTDNTSTQWETGALETVGDIFNMNVAGGLGALGLRKVGEEVVNLGSSAAAALQSMVKTGPIGAQAGKNLMAGFKDTIKPEQMTSAIQQSIGLAPNPNEAVTLKGPGSLRSFNFTWQFFPENAEESRKVKQVIQELRQRSLPSSTFGKDTGVLNYPDMVIMNFYPWDSTGGTENDVYGWTTRSIIRMKKCVITEIGVNYSPNGIPAFFEGTEMPVSIQLTIGLRELEYILSEDYVDASDDGKFWRENRVKGALAAAVGGAIIGSNLGGGAGAAVGALAGGGVAALDGFVDLVMTTDATGAVPPENPNGDNANPPEQTPNPVQDSTT